MVMNRILLREKIEEEPFEVAEKQKIGVTGMSRGAGTSFAAITLAKALSLDKTKRVTYLEICGANFSNKPLIYDVLGMDKRFEGREFIRFYEEIKQGREIRRRRNLDERINWALMAPEDLKKAVKLAPLEIVRLVSNISGDIIVCDIGDCDQKEEFLKDMDAILFVIDPMPSMLLAGFSSLQDAKRLEYRGKNVVWVLNKMNAGVNKRELQDFIKVKNTIQFPYIEPEKRYAAEYNCKIPYELREIKAQLLEPMKKICQHIMIT